jgi:hypothetical protein
MFRQLPHCLVLWGLDNRPSFTALLAAIALPGCATLGPAVDAPNTSSRRLATTFGTPHVLDCDQILQPKWTFAGSQKNLRVVPINQRMALVYDLMTRTGARTVFQPLAPDFSFAGDGRVLGKNREAQTLDFILQPDSAGGFWAGHRYRTASSRLPAVSVEWAPAATASGAKAGEQAKSPPLIHMTLPMSRGDSVQELWISPGPAHKPWMADVITRTYRFSKDGLTSNWQEDDATTLFHWFQANGQKKTIQLRGTFTDKKRSIAAAQFVSFGDDAPPVAITLEELNDAGARDPVKMGRIMMRPIFSKDANQGAELFAAPNVILSNLDATMSAGDGLTRLYTAWTYSSETLENAQSQIQWLELTLAPKTMDALKIISALNKKHDTSILRRRGAVIASYPPSSLKFRRIKASDDGADDGESTYLTWLTSTSSEGAFVSLPVRAAPQFIGPERDPRDVQTERIPPIAHILPITTPLLAGTSFLPTNTGQALVFYRDAPLQAAPEVGSQDQSTDPTRRDVKICLVNLKREGLAQNKNPSETRGGR